MSQRQRFCGQLRAVLCCLLLLPASGWTMTDTVLVTAEGIADPNADVYKRDKGMMIDDLHKDAERQVIEKAVGIYVDSATLVANYPLIEDKVMSKSRNLIKQIVAQTSPRLGEDGLMHMEIKAEVFIGEVKEALATLNREQRTGLIKEHGTPTISVAVVVPDGARTDKDQAQEPIGRLIGNEVTRDFFESQLLTPTKRYQIQLSGLPDYDTAMLLRQEFVGLRNIFNAELISFQRNGLSLFEVECASGDKNFVEVLNDTILKPLNAKLDGPTLKLMAFNGNVTTVGIEPGKEPGKLQKSLRQAPPASLALTSPARLAKVVADPEIMAKIIQMNPDLEAQLKNFRQQ